MHIPASMLNGAVCPVTLTVSAAGLGLAAHCARKAEAKPSPARFASVTALIFALQMLNFPVQNGTSGHLLGALLGVSLLGIPFSILSMAIVLAVQAFFFGDGGINALGANILNMGFIAAGLGGHILNHLTNKGVNQKLALGIASLLSVLLAATACSLEVALSGAVALKKVIPAMLSIHALIGLGEALLTVSVFWALSSYARKGKANEPTFILGASMLAVVAACLSPFASSFPDGLEWVANTLSFAQFNAMEIPGFFPDYQATFLGNTAAATITAGLIGVALVFAFTFVTGKALSPNVSAA